MPNPKKKMSSAGFSSSLFGVLGEHIYPGRDYSEWKLVFNSSKRSILGNYKGDNWAYDM